MNIATAERLFSDLQKLPAFERKIFFNLLAEKAFADVTDTSHEELFGDLKEAYFTASEAADYLEVSMATFRRYLRDGKLIASTRVGNNPLFLLDDLRQFKQAMNP